MDRILIGVTALLIAVFTGSAFAQTPYLRFTAIPDQDESKLVARYSQLAKYLEGKLGTNVVYVPVPSYSAAVWAFKNSYVQLAWFGGFTGVQARRAVPGSEAIVQGAEDVNFKSYFIANVKAGLKPAKEFPSGIAGKTFTFGARTSTSGSMMPQYFIRKNLNKWPDAVFSRIGFSGNHSRTLELVQSGAYQAGAVDYTVYEAEKKAGKIDVSKVPVIWETPPFPDYQFTIRGDVEKTFGAGFKEKVKQALISLEDKEILGSFGRSKFIPASNDEYKPIEEVVPASSLD